MAVINAVIPILFIFTPPLAGFLAEKVGNFRVLLSILTALGGICALLLLAIPPARNTAPYPENLHWGVSFFRHFQNTFMHSLHYQLILPTYLFRSETGQKTTKILQFFVINEKICNPTYSSLTLHKCRVHSMYLSKGQAPYNRLRHLQVSCGRPTNRARYQKLMLHGFRRDECVLKNEPMLNFDNVTFTPGTCGYLCPTRSQLADIRPKFQEYKVICKSSVKKFAIL